MTMKIRAKSFPIVKYDATQAGFSKVVNFTSTHMSSRMSKKYANSGMETSTTHRKIVDGIASTTGESSSMIVGESITLDNSVLRLSASMMDKLALSHGDTVLVISKLQKKTALVCLFEHDLDDGFGHMNCVVRYNLGVNLGDVVDISPCPDIRYIDRVAVLPLFNDVGNLPNSLFDDFFTPYFDGQYRPLTQDDIFTCNSATQTAAFKVLEVDPPGHGVVSQDTLICWQADQHGKGGTAYKKSSRAFEKYFGGSLGRYSLSGRSPWQTLREQFRGSGLWQGKHHSLSTEALIPKS